MKIDFREIGVRVWTEPAHCEVTRRYFVNVVMNLRALKKGGTSLFNWRPINISINVLKQT
jgi:hypothetical protein